MKGLQKGLDLKAKGCPHLTLQPRAGQRLPRQARALAGGCEGHLRSFSVRRKALRRAGRRATTKAIGASQAWQVDAWEASHRPLESLWLTGFSKDGTSGGSWQERLRLRQGLRKVKVLGYNPKGQDRL